MLRKRFPEARQAYQEALDRAPGSTDALRGLMNAYLALNKTDEAMAVAEVQIGKVPETAISMICWELLYFTIRKTYEGAERHLRSL